MLDDPGQHGMGINIPSIYIDEEDGEKLLKLLNTVIIHSYPSILLHFPYPSILLHFPLPIYH